MKKLMIIILLALAVAFVIWTQGKQSGNRTETGAAKQAVPTAAASMSEELRGYLYEPYTHLRISPPQEIHGYTRYQMASSKFGSLGLRYQIDPDVQGMIEAEGHGITWASVLDDFCRKNQCEWDVISPKTIRIRHRSAAPSQAY